MNRKVVFWLEPNQSVIPVDQIPGAIAEAKYPQPVRNNANGEALNDPNAVNRLLEERNQANLLRLKGIGFSDDRHSESALLTTEEVKSHLAELGLESEIHNEIVSKQRCIELAALSELRFEHWEELTGIGLGEGLYCRRLDGIYPEQFNENELHNLARMERITALEHANSAYLHFPCSPAQLVKFVDDSVPGEFDLPQWFREAVARIADAEFHGTFDETWHNGKSINWRYWMSMKTLSAAQAARLIVGLDPDIFASLGHNGPTRNDTSKLRHRARDIERLALNHGMAAAPASEWLSWARSNGFNIHRLFATEVEGKNAATKSAQLEPSLADDSSRQSAANAARFEGRETCKTHNPTPAVLIHSIRERRDILDPAIEKAIKTAGSHDTAAVYLALRSLALEEEQPFTGSVEKDALCYTDSNNNPKLLSKDALSKRLKRRDMKDQ